MFNNEQAFWYTQHEVNTFFMSSDMKCSQSSISGRREKLHGKENPVSSMTFQKLMISNLRQQLRVECPKLVFNDDLNHGGRLGLLKKEFSKILMQVHC